MSLQVWLPLNGNLNNQGLSNYNLSIFRGTEVYNDAGKIGKCFYANGVNTIKILNIIPDFYNYLEYSLCAWFYIEAQNPSHSGSAIISGGNWNNQLLNLSVSDWSTDHYTKLRISGTSWNNTYTYNFMKNTWYHVVVCSDSNHTYAYVNGVLIGSTAASFLPTNIEGNDICIGGATYYSGMQFFGKINDVRIYNHCLSKKEAEEIAKGLVLHYKLDNNGQGQYNLLKDTNKGNYRWLAPSGNGTGTVTSILIDGINCVRYEMTVKSTNWCVFAFRPTNNVEVMNTLHEIDSYTLSFDIFPSQPINNAIPRYVDGNAQNNLINWPSFSAPANAWYHYEGTAVSSGATQSNQSFYINYLFDIGTYDFKNLKIEIGTKATGYNVHIEESFLSNIIYDSSGYQHNGDLVGTITNSILTPRYNISTHFINGSYGRIQERPSICLPSDAITVNLWTRIDTWGNPISCTEGGGWNFENSSGIQFPVYVASVGYKVANSGVTLTTLGDTWHMLTGTFDRENVKIYIDGVLKKTTATGSTNSIGYANNYLFLAAEASGNNTSPANSTFVGDLSDLRIYCTALTEDQIKELYDTSATIDKNGNVYAREVQEI